MTHNTYTMTTITALLHTIHTMITTPSSANSVRHACPHTLLLPTAPYGCTADVLTLCSLRSHCSTFISFHFISFHFTSLTSLSHLLSFFSFLSLLFWKERKKEVLFCYWISWWSVIPYDYIDVHERNNIFTNLSHLAYHKNWLSCSRSFVWKYHYLLWFLFRLLNPTSFLPFWLRTAMSVWLSSHSHLLCRICSLQIVFSDCWSLLGRMWRCVLLLYIYNLWIAIYCYSFLKFLFFSSFPFWLFNIKMLIFKNLFIFPLFSQKYALNILDEVIEVSFSSIVIKFNLQILFN